MTPTSVRIEVDKANSDDSFDSSEDEDSDGYLTISLDSSELQYMFSIYGDLEVGDDVVLVCNRNGSSYTAGDALEYHLLRTESFLCPPLWQEQSLYGRAIKRKQQR